MRKDEVAAAFRLEPFKALPREEVERHEGAVEVVELPDGEGAGHFLPLEAAILVHANYRWLVSTDSGVRWFGLREALRSDEPEVPFLGDSLLATARALLGSMAEDVSEFRVAGLLLPAAGDRLIIVHVARLRAPLPAGSAQFMGSGELQHGRDDFDADSATLIDHLVAF